MGRLKNLNKRKTKYEKEKYNVLLSVKFQIVQLPYHKMELEEAKSYVKTFIEKIKTL